MKLIIDSGSTKTDWCLTYGEKKIKTAKSEGINPFFQSDEIIARIFRDSIAELQIPNTLSGIYFYGAGIRKEMSNRLHDIILKAINYNIIKNSNLTISVEGDLLGAARALCQHEEGIACILGTGSNSCLYDGSKIIDNTPPLGFILGDEGSGAVLGIKFLNALYKRRLPNSLLEEFEKEQKLSLTEIIERVYRQPMPNRFLASLSNFIHKHIETDEVMEIIIEHFRMFFKNNIDRYNRKDLPVNFIGSMAFHYHKQLNDCALSEGYTIGKIVTSPIDGLIKYHNKHR